MPPRSGRSPYKLCSSVTRLTMHVAVREASAARFSTPLLRFGCSLTSALLAASFAIGPSLAAGQPAPERPKEAPKSVKRLWSEYPLNPATGPRQGGGPQEPSRGELRSSRAPQQDDDGGGTPMPLLVTAAVATLAVMTMVAL